MLVWRYRYHPGPCRFHVYAFLASNEERLEMQFLEWWRRESPLSPRSLGYTGSCLLAARFLPLVGPKVELELGCIYSAGKLKKCLPGSGTGLFRGPPLLRRLLRGFLISLAELLCLPHRTPLHLRPPPPFIILSISAIIVSHQWFPSNFSVAYFEDGEARSSLIPLCGGTTIEGRQR